MNEMNEQWCEGCGVECASLAVGSVGGEVNDLCGYIAESRRCDEHDRNHLKCSGKFNRQQHNIHSMGSHNI